MQCFMCGTEVGKELICPHCGANVLIYKQIIYFSEKFYNLGIEKAKVRDLSGAEEALKRSLSYSKYNIPARTLLGLIYYETGETVRAINEWVVVKNYDPSNEQVGRYLAEIENTPGLMNRINTTIKKYNQAIEYCHHGSTDLAMIQLKKVLASNPRLVKAYQLLALIYIREGRYNDARKQLLEANKIDNNNTITLRYLQEVKEQLKDNFKHHKKKGESVGYSDGDRTVFSPEGIRSIGDGTKAGVLNVLTGLAMGMMICFFLVVPSVKQSMGESESNSLLSVSENLSRSQMQIDDLNAELESLKKDLDKYTGQKDLVGCYETLIRAIDQLNSGDREGAKENAQSVNRELLSDEGAKAYDSIMSDLTPEICQDLFDEGKAFYEAENFESAINNFKMVIEMDENFEEGQALYLLADSLRQTSDKEGAIEYYTLAAVRFPNNEWGQGANDYLNVISN